MNWLRSIIRHFDAWLSRQYGVQEFTHDPLCLLRVQAGALTHPLHLPDGGIPPGAKVLRLHMWNEHALQIPPEGPNLAYGLRLQRQLLHSLRLVAQLLQGQPEMRSAQAVGGVTVHVTLGGADGGRAMLQHFGFTVLPYFRPAGAFGEFWENFYTWWLMWTYNPGSAKDHPMFKLQRTEFWNSTPAFLTLYAPGKEKP